MANEWLRLWHDMPTDPKWRTISRASGQSIATVQAVYLHLLVDGSRNVTRGHTNVTNEDLASALDVTDECIKAVIDAMQGRVLDGDRLTGWELRQPKREDTGNAESGAMSATERKRAQREREKSQTKPPANNDGHDESRKVTTDKDKEEIREDKEKKEQEQNPVATAPCEFVDELKKVLVDPEKTPAFVFVLPDWVDKEKWDLWLKTRKGKKMIPEQKQAQVKKLEKWKEAGLDYALSLSNAADAGYQGLVEPAQKSPNSAANRNSGSTQSQPNRNNYGEYIITPDIWNDTNF